MNLDNSGVYSNLASSELCPITENQSLNCCWKQAKDSSG